MRIVKLENAASEITILQESTPLVFAGSGISMWKPTGLASGASITKVFWDALFSGFARTKGEIDFIDSLVWEFPFEHLFEVCPNQEKARQFLIDTYDSSIPNPVHRALAHAFSKGKISHIITTNYDKCLEAATKVFPDFSFKTIADETQALEYYSDSNSKFIFKIHGTAETDSNGLIFTLRNEGLLPEGKRLLLEKMMSNRVCIFIGYSGLDFDLCPLIGKISGIRIYWNDIKETPQSVNAKSLLESVNGTYVHGDMRELLQEWLGNSCSADFGAKNITVSDIQGIFSENEIALWRIALLNSIGLPKVAIRAISEVKGQLDERERLWHKARALFYEGKYLGASKTFALLALLHSRNGALRQSSNVWFDASDSYRVGGYFFRAVRSLLKGRLISKEYDKPKYLLKKSLLIGNLREGLNMFRLPPLMTNYLKKWLTRNLKRCADLAIKQGSLHDFQQAGLIAERNGIASIDLVGKDLFSPRGAKDGYKHLGYYHAEVMIFADDCLKTDFGKISETDKRELLIRSQKYIEYCELTGQDSNLWKLLASLKRLSEGDGGEFKEKDILRKSFKSCEYSKLMRHLQGRKFGIKL